MSKLTRNGIAYDLTQSPYEEELEYGEDKMKYVFSSYNYRIKFLSKIGENRLKISGSLSNRFALDIKNDILCDIKLYQSIEKRGFLIFFNGVAVECPENITLDGSKVIVKS